MNNSINSDLELLDLVTLFSYIMSADNYGQSTAFREETNRKLNIIQQQLNTINNKLNIILKELNND